MRKKGKLKKGTEKVRKKRKRENQKKMKIISNTKYKLSFFSLISKRSLIKISLTETEIDHRNVHMILTESNNSNHNN
jgi:hypothetical protein